MINVGFISLDILIFLILFIVLFLATFKTGKKLLVVSIISFYPTLLIFNSLLSSVNFNDQIIQAITFIILYIMLSIILWRNIHAKKVHSTFRKIVDYSTLSISFILLLVSIYINSVSSLSSLYNFSGTVTDIISKIPFSLTLIIPIIIILLTNRRDLE